MEKPMILTITIFIVTLLILLKTKIFKRAKIDKNHIQITPPHNLNPLELAYILNGKTQITETFALIPYLGDKGYIKFDFPSNYDVSQACNFKMIKGKEYDGNNAIERYLLKKIFEKGDTVTYEDLSSNAKYEMIFSICNKVMNSKMNYKTLFDYKYKIIKIIIRVAILLAVAVWDFYLTEDIAYTLSILPIPYFMQAISIIGIGGTLTGDDVGVQVGKGDMKLVREKMLTVVILTVLLLGFSCFFVFGKTNDILIPRYIIALIIAIITSAINEKIVSRKKYGEEVYQETLKYKEFLKITPKEGIEQIFNQNKDCYFDVFSYCYTLGMSNKCNEEYDKFFNNIFSIIQTDGEDHKKLIDENQGELSDMEIDVKNELEFVTTLMKMKSKIATKYQHEFIEILKEHNDVILEHEIPYEKAKQPGVLFSNTASKILKRV